MKRRDKEIQDDRVLPANMTEERTGISDRKEPEAGGKSHERWSGDSSPSVRSSPHYSPPPPVGPSGLPPEEVRM